MTHVQIRSNDRGAYTLLVDGHDLSLDVLAEGFKVEFPSDPERPALVSMTLAADAVDIDLPNAALDVRRGA